MLKIISNPKAVNGIAFTWGDLEPQDAIGSRLTLDLDPASKLKVTILGDTNLRCSQCDIDGVTLNFKLHEKVLLSPRRTGNWVGIIALEFSKPVFAVGAKIAVVAIGTPRPFKAIIRAVEKDDKEIFQAFRAVSTDTPDNSALFMGAKSSGSSPRIKRIEFDVEPVVEGPWFEQFAIGSLLYKAG